MSHRTHHLTFLIVFSCFIGYAQNSIFLIPAHSVNAFPTAIRAGTGHAAQPYIAVVSQDRIVKVFNAGDLSEQLSMPAENLQITSLLFSNQAPILYSAKSTGQIDRWDLSKRTPSGGIYYAQGAVIHMAELSQQRLLVAGIDKSFSLLDGASGKRLASTSSIEDDIVGMLVDASGTMALVFTGGGSVQYFGLPELHHIKTSDSQGRIQRVAISADGKWVAIGTPEGSVKLWDVGGSTIASTFSESHKSVTSLAFDPKGRWLVAASFDSTVRVYDLAQRSLLKSFVVKEGYVSASAFAGPELFWIATSGGTINTWTVRETPPDTTPPVITVSSPEEPRKVFGTSVQIRGLARDNNKVAAILLDQGVGKIQITDVPEKDRVAGMTMSGFVLDGKLENVGDNTFVIRAIDEFGNVARSSVTIHRLSAEQAVEITNPPFNFEADKVSVKLQFKLWCDAASYKLSVNLMDVGEQTNLFERPPGQEYTEEIPLYVGYNQIQLTVITRKGDKIVKPWAINRKVYGAVAVAPSTKPLPATRDKGVGPQLWAVVVGISEYANKAIPALRYADQDALAFAEFLQKPEGGEFAPDHMRLLVNKDATLANVKEALVEFLSHAIDKDLVLIFFAGHGAPDPARPQNLYMLTYDTDPSRPGTTAYPMWEMQTLLMRQLSAKRIIVFSDACHSGGISVDFAARGVSTAESNLVNQYLGDLARSKEGIVVFTASAAGEVSQEFPELGHGVFTYYLLQGMKGEADLNNDYTVTINELMQYVEEQVKRKTNGAQNPTRSQTLFDKDLTISKIAH